MSWGCPRLESPAPAPWLSRRGPSDTQALVTVRAALTDDNLALVHASLQPRQLGHDPATDLVGRLLSGKRAGARAWPCLGVRQRLHHGGQLTGLNPALQPRGVREQPTAFFAVVWGTFVASSRAILSIKRCSASTWALAAHAAAAPVSGNAQTCMCRRTRELVVERRRSGVVLHGLDVVLVEFEQLSARRQ
jgi:hypothetical protein